jgi:hypothetical protein
MLESSNDDLFRKTLLIYYVAPPLLNYNWLLLGHHVGLDNLRLG